MRKYIELSVVVLVKKFMCEKYLHISNNTKTIDNVFYHHIEFTFINHGCKRPLKTS